MAHTLTEGATAWHISRGDEANEPDKSGWYGFGTNANDNVAPLRPLRMMADRLPRRGRRP